MVQGVAAIVGSGSLVVWVEEHAETAVVRHNPEVIRAVRVQQRIRSSFIRSISIEGAQRHDCVG